MSRIVNNTGNLTIEGDVSASGDVSAFSDKALKTNVSQIQNALETVSNLTGVTYEKDGKHSLGLIAQDVQAVLPELVHRSGGHLSVVYGNLVAVLIEAIKELKAEVQSLKAEK